MFNNVIKVGCVVSMAIGAHAWIARDMTKGLALFLMGALVLVLTYRSE
jgi:hypothetical protein